MGKIEKGQCNRTLAPEKEKVESDKLLEETFVLFSRFAEKEKSLKIRAFRNLGNEVFPLRERERDIQKGSRVILIAPLPVVIQLLANLGNVNIR